MTKTHIFVEDRTRCPSVSHDEDSFSCIFREDILIGGEDTLLELCDILARVIFVEFAELYMRCTCW
jgi:hypothetical protein